MPKATGPAGPWRETRHGFGPRPERFDCWHLSPGPMLLDDPERPIMFYNGATRDGRWGIGWVEFDHCANRVLDRCEEPLIALPAEEDGRAVAFAASLIDHCGEIDLYLSYNDRSPQRLFLCEAPTIQASTGRLRRDTIPSHQCATTQSRSFIVSAGHRRVGQPPRGDHGCRRLRLSAQARHLTCRR